MLAFKQYLSERISNKCKYPFDIEDKKRIPRIIDRIKFANIYKGVV